MSGTISTRGGFPRERPWRGRSVGFWILVLSFCFPSVPVWSQGAKKEPAKGPEPVRVNVGVSTAKPGDFIDIPLTLSAPDQAKVGSVRETITFPKKTLSLKGEELGLAGEQSGAEIQADVKDSSEDAEFSRIDVTLSSKELLKPGILAYLKFQVAPDAKKGAIALKVLDFKASAPGGGTLEATKGKDGEITIFAANEEIPIVGCFFFTH